MALRKATFMSPDVGCVRLVRFGPTMLLLIACAACECTQVKNSQSMNPPAGYDLPSTRTWKVTAINDCKLVFNVDGVRYETTKSATLLSLLLRAAKQGTLDSVSEPGWKIIRVEHIASSGDLRVVVAANAETETLVGHKIVDSGDSHRFPAGNR